MTKCKVLVLIAFLEVHPGPTVVKGFSEFRKAQDFWMSPDFKAIRYEIKDLKINISKSGDTAWWLSQQPLLNPGSIIPHGKRKKL